MLNPVERRAHVFAAARAVNGYTLSAVMLAALAILAALAVAIFRPDQMATMQNLITTILLPLILGLFALGQKAFATVVNGQMGQIIHAVQEKGEAQVEAAHAQGVVRGLEKAPELLKNGPVP